MPESERRVLEGQVAAAGRAQALIADAYQPLVDSMAQRYKGVGVASTDVVVADRQGLQRAVERFDWSKGTRFSAYATWWIRQAMTATSRSA